MNSSPTPALFTVGVDGNFCEGLDMTVWELETILWPLQEYRGLPHPLNIPYMDENGYLEGQG